MNRVILVVLLFCSLIQCWNDRNECYQKEGIVYNDKSDFDRLDLKLLGGCGFQGLFITQPTKPPDTNKDRIRFESALLNCYIIEQKRKKCDKEMNGPWLGEPYIWEKGYK